MKLVYGISDTATATAAAAATAAATAAAAAATAVTSYDTLMSAYTSSDPV